MQFTMTATLKPLPSNSTFLSTNSSALLCTRIPRTSIDAYGSSECVLYARTLKHLKSKPPVALQSTGLQDQSSTPYEIRTMKSSEMGMCATRSLDVGDLILTERPLFVIPINTDIRGVQCPEVYRQNAGDIKGMQTPMPLKEATMEVAFNRMSKENQKAYLALSNAHTHDGSFRLFAIWRTNSFAFFDLGKLGGEDDLYGVVLKEYSRVNHSCRQNCCLSIDVDSFSCQLRATRAIAPGEDIVCSYINEHLSTEERQALLKPYGFQCACFSCCPSPSNLCSNSIRSLLRDRILEMQKTYTSIEDAKVAREGYDTCLQLLHDLEREGLDGCHSYQNVMHWLVV
ncbi:hypothetical protein BDQ17DRAFT_1375024, partial [Cyathus striatus]